MYLKHILLAWLSVGSIQAQSVTNLLNGAQCIRLGGEEDQVLGVASQGTNFVWYGFRWTAEGPQQGRTYLKDGIGQDVSWAADGIVSGLSESYAVGSSSGIPLFGSLQTTDAIPDLENAGFCTPVAVNSNGVAVGFTLDSQPFVYSHGITTRLPTPNKLPASAVAISPSGVIAGYVYPTNGLNTAAVVWENGTCQNLSTGLVDSMALCVSGSLIGGTYDEQAAYWTKVGSQWVMTVLRTNGYPVQRQISAIHESGYLGGHFDHGSGFFGKIGENQLVDLSGKYGLPASVTGIAGLASANGYLAMAIQDPESAWGLIARVPTSSPILAVAPSGQTLTISWDQSPGWVLQFSPSLKTNSWTACQETVQASGQKNFVVMNINVAPTNRFFRLRSP
jgi:hypothetical protein